MLILPILMEDYQKDYFVIILIDLKENKKGVSLLVSIHNNNNNNFHLLNFVMYANSLGIVPTRLQLVMKILCKLGMEKNTVGIVPPN